MVIHWSFFLGCQKSIQYHILCIPNLWKTSNFSHRICFLNAKCFVEKCSWQLPSINKAKSVMVKCNSSDFFPHKCLLPGSMYSAQGFSFYFERNWCPFSFWYRIYSWTKIIKRILKHVWTEYHTNTWSNWEVPSNFRLYAYTTDLHL